MQKNLKSQIYLVYDKLCIIVNDQKDESVEILWKQSFILLCR